jgi:hypothetical protein
VQMAYSPRQEPQHENPRSVSLKMRKYCR